MFKSFVLTILLTVVTAQSSWAQNTNVEACKTKATEAQTACSKAQDSSAQMAQVFMKLAIMVAALASGGSQGGMCQMMASMSQMNANQLQSSNQPCQNAAAACKTSCATAAADTGTKSAADQTNLSAAQNNCQVAEKQGTAVNNDMLKLLDIAATAAVCLKELGMKKDETTTTTTAAAPQLNCTDPAQATNPICICQANPFAGGCGNKLGDVKSIEAGESRTPPATDGAPSSPTVRNDDMQGNRREASATGKGDVPRGTSGAKSGADGGVLPGAMAGSGPVKPGSAVDVLSGSQGGGGAGARPSGGGYPEFVNTGSGLRPLSRAPSAASVGFGPGGLMGKHRDLFKVVHKRYKSVFGGE